MWAIKQNKKINDKNDELDGRFSMILPVIYGSSEECLYRSFEEFQYLSINDSAFVEKLEQTIIEMIETNSIYIG